MAAESKDPEAFQSCHSKLVRDAQPLQIQPCYFLSVWEIIQVQYPSSKPRMKVKTH